MEAATRQLPGHPGAPHLSQERELYRELARGRAARAILVQGWGSVPREAGAKMLVFPDGSIRGTVGGGCGEAEVWQAAMDCLRDGVCGRVEVDLTEDESSDSGKVCGGRFEVFIDIWEGLTLPEEGPCLLVTCLGPRPARAWRGAPAGSGACAWAAGESRVLVADDGLFWNLAFSDGLPKLVERDGHEFFLDPLGMGQELVIAGAGHIARPLSRMASMCGYSVVVIDDRAEYARAELFPEARVVCQDFGQFFAEYAVHPGSHVVLVTRGHKLDEDCLRSLVGRSIFYLGMIGSRRRTRAVLDELRSEGVNPAWLARICAPIGLNIGALTPEEIAVSILSEMILFRRGGTGGSLRGSGKGPSQAKFAAPSIGI
ncbi:MAG: XdhC family protein [Candidatus Eremiobacteraeota bacterium]|nr:XdhC family protein [Candidatus Eremiobacteraeota bacterium]MCW5866688.1 XdhC family protein [Candidatus Eremiobacteraeota bacterium]